MLQRRGVQEAEATADSGSAGLGSAEAGPFSRQALEKRVKEMEARNLAYAEARGEATGFASSQNQQLCRSIEEVKELRVQLTAAQKGAAAVELLREERERDRAEIKELKEKLATAQKGAEEAVQNHLAYIQAAQVEVEWRNRSIMQLQHEAVRLRGETQAQIDELQQQLVAARQRNLEVEELKKERDELLAKVREGEESMRQAREQHLASENELADLREQVKAGKERTKEAEGLKQHLEATNAEVDELKRQVEEGKASAVTLEQCLAEANAEIERLKQWVEAGNDRKDTVERLEQELVTTNVKIGELAEILAASQKDTEETVQSHLAHIQAVQAEMEKLHAELESNCLLAKDLTQEHVNQLGEAQVEVDVLQKQLEELKEERDGLLAKVREGEESMKEAEVLKQQLATANAEIDELKKHMKTRKQVKLEIPRRRLPTANKDVERQSQRVKVGKKRKLETGKSNGKKSELYSEHQGDSGSCSELPKQAEVEKSSTPSMNIEPSRQMAAAEVYPDVQTEAFQSEGRGVQGGEEQAQENRTLNLAVNREWSNVKRSDFLGQSTAKLQTEMTQHDVPARRPNRRLYVPSPDVPVRRLYDPSSDVSNRRLELAELASPDSGDIQD